MNGVPIAYCLIAVCGFIALPLALMILAALTGAYDD